MRWLSKSLRYYLRRSHNGLETRQVEIHRGVGRFLVVTESVDGFGRRLREMGATVGDDAYERAEAMHQAKCVALEAEGFIACAPDERGCYFEPNGQKVLPLLVGHTHA